MSASSLSDATSHNSNCSGLSATQLTDPECLGASISHWWMLLLVMLAPVLRSGGIVILETVLTTFAHLGRPSQRSSGIFIQIEDGSLNEYLAMDPLVMTTRAAFLHKETWSRIKELLQLGPKEMACRAFMRACFFFLAEPCTFALLFYTAFPSMDDFQCIFAVLVLIYESILLLLVVVMLVKIPGFLFFDAMAHIQIGKVPLAARFIFSPDSILVGPEVSDVLDKSGGVLFRYYLMMLKMCSGLAFMAGALAKELYPPLAGFYCITFVNVTWTIAVMACGNNLIVKAITEALQYVITAAPRFWALCAE